MHAASARRTGEHRFRAFGIIRGMEKKHAENRASCAVAIMALSLPFAAMAIDRMDYPDADTVVLDDATRIEYAADGTYTEENDERILALTEKGRRSLRTFSISVSRRYGSAEIVSVEIIGTNGVARPVDFAKTLKEATDNSSTAANIYDPLDRIISCSVPGMEIGETRRIVSRMRTVKPRMRGAFATGALFEAMRPVVNASMEVIAPAGLPLARIKLRNPVGKTVERSPDETLPDGRVRMKWTARNVPQAFPEPDMPPFSSVAQKLLVSTCGSWEEVSRWYWNLCEPHLGAVNEAMTNKVASLVRGASTRMERIRALFKFVSQEIRYMGLMMEDESPGYSPHDVRITFDNRYGVCRDKAALLVAMLRMAGMDARPVLISVGPKLDGDVPLPYFNHAIVAVAPDPGETSSGGGSWMLMDPTNENTKDLLPAYLMDCSYLVAHPEGCPLATVPVTPAEENAFVVRTDGSLEPDGSALVRTVASFRGVNDLLRGSLVRLTPKERRRAFESVVRRVHPGAELLSFEMKPLDLRDTDTPMEASLTVRIPDLVMRGRTRDELTVPFVLSGFGVADRLLSGATSLDTRRYPLTFFSTAKVEEKVCISTGDSLGDVMHIPADVAVGTNGCRYVRRMRMKDGEFTAIRSRTIGVTELSPDGYAALKDDLEEIELGTRTRPRFAARPPAREANVRLLSDVTEVRLRTPFSWTVTNTWEKEVLTYAGKKASAELVFSVKPAVSSMEVVSATVSNRNGRVFPVTPAEMNLLDAGWAASAPRYAASKRLVVNLPAVETGSVIRVTAVGNVTNSPIAYCRLFTFDSTDPIGIKSVTVDGRSPDGGGVPFKVVTGGDLGNVTETRHFSLAVTNPAALPREGRQPPALLWRRSAMVSAADLDEYRRSLFDALAEARAKGSAAAAAKAIELAGDEHRPEDRIAAVRNWLWRNVRMAGPGLFDLPFDQAFFPPDRSLSDGYASAADWMNLYFAMLEAVGFDVEFVLSDGDANGHEALARARRNVPQPDDFDDIVIRARIKEGGWLFGLLGGEERTFVLDYESEYTPLGVRDVEGRNGRTESHMTIDLNETGAARITVSNSTWGVAVGALRKRYAEMLPEMRARHHTELVGDIAESAEAISGLEADVEGYPFSLVHSVYAPGYAAKSGDTLVLAVPGIGGTFLPEGEAGRKSPFEVSGRLRPSVIVREVVFPEGFTEIEHMPEPWEISLPGDGSARCRLSVESRMEDGRLHVVFREEHLPGRSRMFKEDWLGFFRGWNRRTGSRLSRTVSVRTADRAARR